MTKLQIIERKIRALEKRLTLVKGKECEVYTRIVGYYRAVKNWNAGQEAQRKQRKYFKLEVRG